MKKKAPAHAAPDFLKSREDIISYLTPIIEKGNHRDFEAASTVALRALKAMTEFRVLRSDRDWFLKEWMELKGLSQLRISHLTGWSTGKVNEVYHGDTPYRRETVNTLADVLQIEPYELLLHPTFSQWLRQLTDVARTRPEGFEEP